MQATQDENHSGTYVHSPDEVHGIFKDPGGVIEVLKPGWVHPVATTVLSSPPVATRCERGGISYLRVEISNLKLSQASALLLLQGASIRSLFSDVLLSLGQDAPHFYSLIYASVPCLWRPPPVVDRAVFAWVIDRPVDVHPEKLFQDLFLAELGK